MANVNNLIKEINKKIAKETDPLLLVDLLKEKFSGLDVKALEHAAKSITDLLSR